MLHLRIENFLPINRLASKTVFFGFIATWFFAESPINLSESVNATNDGVVRFPWSLATISTRSCCLFVVVVVVVYLYIKKREGVKVSSAQRHSSSKHTKKKSTFETLKKKGAKKRSFQKLLFLPSSSAGFL